MAKTLILVKDSNTYFWKNCKSTELVDIKTTYLRKFNGRYWKKKRNCPQNNYRYYGVLNTWIFHLKRYDKIIVLDSAYTKQADFFLKNTKAKKYFFYWNPLHKDENVARIHINSLYEKFEIYSYNRYDCDKYGLNFNTTMYSAQDIVNRESKINLLFVGYVFGRRLSQIDEILDEMNKYGLEYEVYAVRDPGRTGRDYIPRNYKLLDTGIDYDKYIDKVFETKVILDVDKYDEVGCSLRAMESIFYQKKLITTNLRVKEELFYDSQNVFIWGMDSVERLKEFVESPYKQIDKEIINYYRIEEWIKRFA